MNVDIVALIGLIGTISGVYLGFWKAKKDGEKNYKGRYSTKYSCSN
ncbi:hypothetical protein [Clostridium baratii]